jgi:hypothetical protein
MDESAGYHEILLLRKAAGAGRTLQLKRLRFHWRTRRRVAGPARLRRTAGRYR